MATEASTSSAASTLAQSRGASTETLFLRSKVDPEFRVEVGPAVLDYCSILRNVSEHSDNSDAVEVDMTQEQLQQFVDLHNHFSETDDLTDEDYEWANAFFKKMPDDEFKTFCWKADFLDSDRFLVVAAKYVMAKLEDMEVQEIQQWLNIVDDYTAEEREAMEAHPLEFFTGVAFERDDPVANVVASDDA